MRPDLLLPAASQTDIVECAISAEDLGYATVWLSELWGKSAPIQATQIALETTDISIGTAILNVFSRSPAVLAMTATSLSELTDDRFVLGVGTSTAKAVEDLHGTPFDQPVRRAHETIDLIQQFTRGSDPVTYDGTIYQVADFPGLETEVPVYAAALGEANRRMVGRLCDGWIPHNIPFPDLEASFETVSSAAKDVGRDPNEIVVAPYIPSAVSEDLSEARDAIRGHIAYYVGSGTGYRRAVEARFPEEAVEVATRWQDRDRGAAVDAVTDDMVRALGIAATPDTASDRFTDLVANSIIDRPIITVPGNAPELIESTVTSLAPS